MGRNLYLLSDAAQALVLTAKAVNLLAPQKSISASIRPFKAAAYAASEGPPLRGRLAVRYVNCPAIRRCRTRVKDLQVEKFTSGHKSI